MTQYKKKLIEVALPLEAINIASAREKSIRHGHPSTLHLWWARRPLAACRAVLFSSLVDDPSSLPDQFPTEADQERERHRLFKIIEDLVLWENSNNPKVLNAAKAEIMKSTGGNPPPVLDPFCGGGSIPLEAQRLGLEAHGSDLNPVAVLITKALIEIPPKFGGRSPINPDARKHGLHTGTWHGAAGLAEDVRYYGEWMRKEAEKRIGELYPKATVYVHRNTGQMYNQQEFDEMATQERTLISDPSSLLPHPADMDKQELTVIAWLWARTVKCPNPGCAIQMPLARTFAISTKSGKEAWVEPCAVGFGASRNIQYSIRRDGNTPPKGTVSRRGARCIACGSPVPLEHVRAEGCAKRMGAQLMAIVAEGERGRVYLPPDDYHEQIAKSASPKWEPELELPQQALGFRVQGYGMTQWADLFTKRQLAALTVFSDLVSEAAEQARADANSAGMDAEYGKSYADAVRVYLAFTLDKQADLGNGLNRWEPIAQCPRQLFGRQAIPMVWDYAEGNPLGNSSGSWTVLVANQQRGLLSTALQFAAEHSGHVYQADAASPRNMTIAPVVSTDPPYYDNVPYADLSDFFYCWLRRSLKNSFPTLFSTVQTPKSNELVADPFRRGGQSESRTFFEGGMTNVFRAMRRYASEKAPVTVFYAFKQSETEDDDDHSPSNTASTGWETMLEALLVAGFQVTGTWPMRTENASRMRGQNSNALASSIVLVCRPRPDEAPITSLREFIQALRYELEGALIKMMHGNIAPVDLAQATIGPGMTVYSRYGQVLDADGSRLSVRGALQIINQELDTVLSAQEGEYDSDTRFCIGWFEQNGMNSGSYGSALTLATARGTTPEGCAEAGIVEAKSGAVRLLKREEYSAEWNPSKDRRRPIWGSTQYLVRALLQGGEGGAARVAAVLGGEAEIARDLAYRLYSICERKGWSQEALAYNSLVIAWPAIMDLAGNPNIAEPTTGLFAEIE